MSATRINTFLPNSLIHDLSFDENISYEEIHNGIPIHFPTKIPNKWFNIKRSFSKDNVTNISRSIYDEVQSATNPHIPTGNRREFQNYSKNSTNQSRKSKKINHQNHMCTFSHIKGQFINSSSNFGFYENYRPPTKKNSERIIQKLNFDDPLNFTMPFTTFLTNYGGCIGSIMKKNIGSRYLQQMIDSISQNDINMFFYYTCHDLVELMCDQYANYFIQKIIKKCNFSQRIFIYNKLNYDFLQVAKNISGTHCLQALIEGMNTPQEEQILFQIIHSDLLELSTDQNATHLIQKIIQQLPESRREYLNQFILIHLVELSKHPNGICVVKQFITFNKEEMIRNHILYTVSAHCGEITLDQYGNYIIQHILEKYGYLTCYNITHIICNNFVCFSTEKYSSNVIDKVILYLSKHNHNEFVQLIKQMFFEDNHLFELLKSKFGTFVLTNCLKLLSQNEQKVIKSFLKDKLSFHDEEYRTLFCRLRRLMQ